MKVNVTSEVVNGLWRITNVTGLTEAGQSIYFNVDKLPSNHPFHYIDLLKRPTASETLGMMTQPTETKPRPLPATTPPITTQTQHQQPEPQEMEEYEEYDEVYEED